MTSIAESAGIRINGVGVSMPSPGGPALAAALESGIVLAVSAPDGSPVTGLNADDFSVSALSRGRDGVTARTISPRAVTEPMAGVYTISLDRSVADRGYAAFACVVEVQEARHRDRSSPTPARILVPLGC